MLLPPVLSTGRKGRGNSPAVFFSTVMHVSTDRQKQLEATARADFELRAGRKLTADEWAIVRAKLLEFVGILRGWEQTTARLRRGNFEVLCDREP